jgi:hypothetical protein
MDHVKHVLESLTYLMTIWPVSPPFRSAQSTILTPPVKVVLMDQIPTYPLIIPHVFLRSTIVPCIIQILQHAINVLQTTHFQLILQIVF